MPTIEEALGQQKPIEAVLKAGLENLSANQVITFTKYVKLILPLDGFVFWVKADQLSPSAALNGSPFNQAAFDGGGTIAAAANEIKVKGSLHFDTRTEQGETETYSINRCIFTAEEKIDAFNQIGPNILYIARPPTPPFENIRFAFSSRGPYYEEANLYHYLGDAIYADMESQIIDNPAQFRRGLIVSNSLPFWLSMSHWQQKDFEPFGNSIPLYPSFLSPENMRPPFGTVHIAPEDTHAMGSTPSLGRTYSHDQLTRDRVKLTFYGLTNQSAMEFVDFVNQYISFYETMGLLNMPIMRDEKRVQSELSAIAMKKSIIYEVSYLQSQARDIARQLILKAIPSFIFPD